MTTSTTFSLALPTELLQRIDHAAATAGLSRSAYVLSWLPETHENISHNGGKADGRSRRKSRGSVEVLAPTVV